MAKRKSKKNKSKLYLYINIITGFIVFLAIFFAIYNKLQKKPITHQHQSKSNKCNTSHKEPKFEELTKSLEIEYVDEDEEIEYEILSAGKPIDKNSLIKEELPTIHKKTQTQIKPIKKVIIPKLAIIIDDISTFSQVKQLNNIGYPITLSFLPPENGRKYSAQAAKIAKYYMIHLPCEAKNRAFDEPKTLHTEDPYYVYDERIAEVKNYFPKATYINNHTGSVLTANHKSMNRLMKALKKYGFCFVDSVTTQKTVAKKYAKKYGVKYLARNVFIDNVEDTNYILKQIQKAIKLAKKRGYAIAIGHPHKVTIKALKLAKKYFHGIKLVYINQL